MDKFTLSTCIFKLKADQSAAFAKQFEFAMEAGFTGFEIDMHPDEDVSGIIQAIKDTQAPVIAIHGVLNGFSCSPDPQVRKKAAADAAAYLEKFAQFAPCPVVEHYFNRVNAPEVADYFHDTCGMLLEKMEKLRFLFCMENAPYKPEENERYPDFAEIAAFARSFGENRMFVTFDLNHGNLNEDPQAICRNFTGMIRHIHVSDNHGLREEHLSPGLGTINLGGILQSLYANGYSGPCNLEVGLRQDHQPTLEQYRQIYEYMQQITNW